MAVTKTLLRAVPYNLNNKVQTWDFTMQYNQGSKTADPPTYCESQFIATIPATDPRTGTANFTPKAEASWTKAELLALCPIAKWDAIFASQVDSIMTNPPDDPVADPDYVIPS